LQNNVWPFIEYITRIKEKNEMGICIQITYFIVGRYIYEYIYFLGIEIVQ
jgi:hypothetical protein